MEEVSSGGEGREERGEEVAGEGKERGREVAKEGKGR